MPASITGGYSNFQGVDRNIKKSFDLKHNGKNIFLKSFNGSDSSVVDLSTGEISLEEHFFVSGEELEYIHPSDGAPIGIATTTITGIGQTDKLPQTVYAISVSSISVRLAITTENALKTIPTYLELTSLGSGNNHILKSKDPNKKSLIVIDNIVQSPIVSVGKSTTLSFDLNNTSSILYLSDVTDFAIKDIIQINDEIMSITSVGIGSTNSVYVERFILGSNRQSHSAGDLVKKLSGVYNIVDNVLHFSDAPYGDFPVGLGNNPDEVDYVGLTTRSKFQGRIFLRNGSAGQTTDPYSTNYNFDDISESFNGITSSFTLKSKESDIINFFEDGALVFVKNSFQTPQKPGNYDPSYAFKLEENGNQTDITFTGVVAPNDFDVKVSTIPVGGIIVNIGSTEGFGYQSIISAGGTAVVSYAGTIQSIDIQNRGSGYRVGIQTIVNVGVQTESSTGVNIENVGIASISNGRVVSVAITNPGTGYTSTNPPVVVFDSPIGYDNVPLIYSSSSISGIGTGAKVNIVVGQGSSVTEFSIQNYGYAYEPGETLTVASNYIDGIPKEYFGRFVDGSNLIYKNKEFIQNEVVGFITTTYPSILSNPDYSEVICKRDIGYIVDAISYDLAFGGNTKTVAAGLAYWINGTSYVDGESIETIAGYQYIAGISSYIINNISVPVSYQPGITSVSQFIDNSIDYDASCNPSAYSENCCADVWSAIGSYVGIVTTIIGIGTTAAPKVTSPYSRALQFPIEENFEEFQIYVDKIYNEDFFGQSIGNLEVFDSPQNLFNGVRKTFPLKINNVRKSILKAPGSPIDLVSTLLVFINDILQIPGEGYYFDGGSSIEFSEPPRGPQPGIENSGDKCTIIFYAGTKDVDVINGEVPETIKKGDEVTLLGDDLTFQQEPRVVTFIEASDVITTNPYANAGISENREFLRPLRWCKQTEDLIINQEEVPKTRVFYEPQINPSSNIIENIGTSSTVFYVKSVKPLFDEIRENQTLDKTYTIEILRNNETSAATATAYIGAGGSITNVVINSGGSGYLSEPEIFISSPVGLGTTAVANSSIVNGSVTGITFTNPGYGYTQAPLIMIAPPSTDIEVIEEVSYEGDSGIIVGISTTSIANADNGIVFDLFIPIESNFRSGEYVGIPTAVSLIQDDYFVNINNTSVGGGNTSLRKDSSTILQSDSFLDNIYQVISSSTESVNISGIGVTSVRRVVVSVSSFNGLPSSFNIDGYCGEFSWGKITVEERLSTKQYSIIQDYGYSGISSFPIIRRKYPLRYIDYIV